MTPDLPGGIHRETILQTKPIAYEGEARQCPHCYSIYLPFVEGCGFAYPEQSQCDECTCGSGAKPTDRVWVVVRGKRYRGEGERSGDDAWALPDLPEDDER